MTGSLREIEIGRLSLMNPRFGDCHPCLDRRSIGLARRPGLLLGAFRGLKDGYLYRIVAA